MPIKLPPSLREIERKFTFDRQCIPRLLTNTGLPPFTSLSPFKRSIFKDTYYDTPKRVLSKNPDGAIWLRTRIYDPRVPPRYVYNNQHGTGVVGIDSKDYKFPEAPTLMRNWQAKVAKLASKDYKSASYDEVTDLSEIRRLIQKRVYPGHKQDSHQLQAAENNFGLEEYCKFITDRIEFTADGKFTVALDKTDIGHEQDVGEVEVLAEEGQEDAQVLDEIEEFLERYRWLFKSGKGEPKGKMTMYFEKYGGW